MTGGPLRARVGVHAALAMPLRSATGMLEVLSVYAHGRDTSDGHHAANW
jgi:hypothetical protein